jgi:DNA (cytosine-5)-methyltransferase 1
MNDDETWVEGDHANTLNSFDAGDVRTTHAVLASFYSTGGSQQGFARTDGVSPTLKVGSGLDIASPVAIVSDSYYVEDCENAALRANGANDGPPRTDKHPLVVETFPIDDGRDLEKHQNGTGIGAAGDPAYTIDRQQRPAVAYSIREDATAGNFSATEIDAARCLQKHQPSVQSHHAQTFISEQMSVRRLTPVECERLMGWQDQHTAPEGVKAPDSKRYAACGDGIVAPVAFWIADRIRMIEGEA